MLIEVQVELADNRHGVDVAERLRATGPPPGGDLLIAGFEVRLVVEADDHAAAAVAADAHLRAALGLSLHGVSRPMYVIDD